LDKNTVSRTFIIITLLVLILGRFWIVGTAKVLFNTQSSDGDESAYLSLGLNLREAGVLSDGTRPPLYALSLAPVAEREWTYFTWAKLITLAQGAMAVLVVFLAGRSMFGWQAGLLAAFLLAANREFHFRAATIYADTLLVTLFLASWYFLIRGFENRRDLALAGLFTGLAYLTKASALLHLGTWGLVALGHYRQSILRQKQLLLVPALFLGVTLPLLIYNARHFGSPFYNFATSHVMWMDSWAESQVADPAAWPTRATYFQTHTPADMLSRLQAGAARLNPELARTLIPSREWSPPWLGWVLLAGAVLTGAALLIWGRSQLKAYYQRRKLTLQFTAILFIGFYLFSVWYAAVLIESRFLIPVLGPFYLLLADAVVSLGRGGWLWLGHRRSSYGVGLRWGYAGLGTLLGLAGLWWLAHTTWIDRWSLTVDPFESDDRANIEAEAVVNWLEQTRPDGPVQMAFGPSKSLPLWKFPRRFRVDRIPVDMDTWAALDVYLQTSSPDFIIIDSDTVRRRRAALSDFFGYDEDRDFVTIEQIPQAWVLRHLFSAPQGFRWAIFSPSAGPPVARPANFGHTIDLLGYQTHLRPVQAGIALDVTLYWQPAARPAQDYTVFVHLTAPDGFAKTQMDRPPFEGLWPTSRWQPGQVLVDRFSLELDPSLFPGDYLLVTGLYDPVTGERLSLATGKESPSPDAALLDHFRLDED